MPLGWGIMPIGLIECQLRVRRVSASCGCVVRLRSVARAHHSGIWVRLACLILAVVGAILLLIAGDVERNPGPVLMRTCHKC